MFLVGAYLVGFDLDSLLSGLILTASILDFVMFGDLLCVCLHFVRFAGFDLIVNRVVDFFHDMVYLLDFLDYLDFLYLLGLLVVGVRIADMFAPSAGLSIQLVVVLFVELVWR